MQCTDIEHAIEEGGLLQLPEAALAHVGSCPSCTALIEDFAAIVSAAGQIPEEVEPPARVWVSLRAQLEAEGIIRQPPVAVAAERAPWWYSVRQLFSGRRLAAASVALLIAAAGSYRYLRQPATPNGPVAAGVSQPEPFADTATTLDQEEQSLGSMQPASTLGSISSVDSSLRENLATVNAFIKECRKRLAEDPNDQMARDYLSTAYQQKAEILAAMMERGRSVN
jgi:hypothetical protein